VGASALIYALNLNFLAAHLQMPLERAGHRLQGGDFKGKCPTDFTENAGAASLADCLGSGVDAFLAEVVKSTAPPASLNQDNSGLSGAASS
jgi:hypothetical protein